MSVARTRVLAMDQREELLGRDPTTRLIEAVLDFALLAGFISAMGFLVRLAF